MQRSTAFILSLLILLSSSGITFAQHFCGGNPVSSKITLGEGTLSCGMMNMKEDTCGAEKKIEKHSCCDDQYLAVDIDSHYNKAHFEFPFLNFKLPVIKWNVVIDEVCLNFEKTAFQVYRPPPLQKDFQVLYETFVI